MTQFARGQEGGRVQLGPPPRSQENWATTTILPLVASILQREQANIARQQSRQDAQRDQRFKMEQLDKQARSAAEVATIQASAARDVKEMDTLQNNYQAALAAQPLWEDDPNNFVIKPGLPGDRNWKKRVIRAKTKSPLEMFYEQVGDRGASMLGQGVLADKLRRDALLRANPPAKATPEEKEQGIAEGGGVKKEEAILRPAKLKPITKEQDIGQRIGTFAQNIPGFAWNLPGEGIKLLQEPSSNPLVSALGVLSTIKPGDPNQGLRNAWETYKSFYAPKKTSGLPEIGR